MEANPGDATWGAILIEGLEVEDGGSTQDIDLELAGKIAGTVRDADGNGLRRARLNISTEGGTNILMNSWTRSRGGGSYTVNGLGPGDVWVSASYEGRTSSREKIVVRKGSTTQYDIVIP